MKKALWYVTVILAGALTIMSLFLSYIAFVPPSEYRPDDTVIPDQSSFDLEEKVGWYLVDDGSEWMITWRPQGGLMGLNFVDFAHTRMKPVSENQLTWFKGGDSLAVTYYDSLQQFVWTDSTGTEHVAKRMDQPYYLQRELSWHNRKTELKGLLMIPNEPEREIRSAAVVIHGSGTSHRNNFWYLYQADYLAKKGIMILLPDKRGSGASGGSWHTSSMTDFAEDAIAGARKIQDLNIADSLNIGFLGFSQGGAIAPLAANLLEETDFMINVGGSAVSFNEQIRFEIYNDVRARGIPEILAPAVTWAYSRRAKARRPVWWEKNGEYDPTPYIEKLEIPSLVIYGGQDTNAPVRPSVEKLRAVQEQKTPGLLTIKVYEESGHAMGDPDTGWIREAYLEFLVEWVDAR